MSNNWSTQIVSDATTLTILTPKFKGCKTKKEIFLLININSHVDLVFENGTKIAANPNEKACVTPCSGNIINGKCVLGPFQFNICSYKQEGKKFRLVLFVSDAEKTLAFTVSPPFLIRAKKPIIRPGLKRKRDEEEEQIEQRPTSKLPPLQGLTPLQNNQQMQQFNQLQFQQQQQLQMQFQQQQQQQQQPYKSLDLESDLDKLIEDSWEVIVNPVEDCYSMYQMMNIEDKKQLLQLILSGSSLSERELLLSKLVKNIKTVKDEGGVEKYFTDFGDLNMENL
eukprot:gene9604-1806_t